MKKIRIVFFGSAAFAVPSLERLLESHPDSAFAAVTQPDRPRGRSLRLASCPVKACATGAGLRVITPESVNSGEFAAVFRDMKPDLAVVVAYGQILKRAILDVPPMGFVNAHASLLPRYRGAAPIQWAVANGETATGVTTMFVNERMDAGDIIAQRRERILEDDTAASLHDRLAQLGAGLLVETIDAIRAGNARRIPQDEAQVCYAPKLSKNDGRIDWAKPAVELHNRVRGFFPWPGCFFRVKSGRECDVKALRCRAESAAAQGAPGKVIEADAADGPLIQAGEGALRLTAVQPAGGNGMSGAEFARGFRIRAGDMLA